MPRVFIQSQLRDLTGGRTEVELPGATLRQVIAALDAEYPGLAARLLDRGGGALAPSLAVSIDGQVTSRGLLARVGPTSEVHFLPAIGGG
jgi:molybdopterin synthase sulfur carrier subunit